MQKNKIKEQARQIKELEARVDRLSRKEKKLVAEKQTLKNKNKALKQQQDRDKAKTIVLKKQLEEESKKKGNYAEKFISYEKIARHHYLAFVIPLCVGLYACSGCGFRKIAEIVAFLNNFFCLGLEKTPCPNTIENWVKKSGYYIYDNGKKKGFFGRDTKRACLNS